MEKGLNNELVEVERKYKNELNKEYLD